MQYACDDRRSIEASTITEDMSTRSQIKKHSAFDQRKTTGVKLAGTYQMNQNNKPNKSQGTARGSTSSTPQLTSRQTRVILMHYITAR